jgi:branched-chain amino acid transport system ATP-binding protein
LKTILGEVVPRSGSVTFQGERIDGLPTRQIVRRGISIVPENRRIFPRLTVLENLYAGAYQRNDKAGIREDLEHVFELFPRLKERTSQYGVTLSGGEQQMLAIGRALMSRPKLILMDEPSMGLAPALVQTVFEKGHIVLADTADNLLKNESMQKAYLGVAGTSSEEDVAFEEVVFTGEER